MYLCYIEFDNVSHNYNINFKTNLCYTFSENLNYIKNNIYINLLELKIKKKSGVKS